MSKKKDQKYSFKTEDPCILAKSGDYRLVKDGDRLLVLGKRICNGLKQEKGDLPNFNPEDHMSALKLTGYDALSDMYRHPYGKGEKNNLFTYTRANRIQWVTKSGFQKQLGPKDTEKYMLNSKVIRPTSVFENREDSEHKSGRGNVRRTVEPKAVPRTPERRNRGSKSDSSDTSSASEDSNKSSSDDEPIKRHRNPPHKSKPLPPSIRKVGSESSDPDHASEVSEASSSDDSTVSRRTVRKNRSSTTPQFSRKNIFARRLFGEIHNIYTDEDGKYDLEQLDCEPDYIHHETKQTFAPAVDQNFLLGRILSNKLKIEHFTLVGCVGFKRSSELLWKAAVLKLDPSTAEKLQKARRQAEVIYDGPALVPMSFFQKRMKGNTRAAEELFSQTTLGQQNGVRNMRYQTLEREDPQENSRSMAIELYHSYDMGKMDKEAEKEWETELVKEAERLTLREKKRLVKKLKKRCNIIENML
jgi:hypothetical protein